MVDISGKNEVLERKSHREIKLKPQTIDAIRNKEIEKGSVLKQHE